MLTVISYIALQYFCGSSWSGWLLVLPVILDLEIIDKVFK